MAKTLTEALIEEIIEEPLFDEPRATGGRAKGSRRLAFMSREELKAYKAERQRIRRRRIRELAKAGIVEFNADSARHALADAAIILLAADAPGADIIQQYLYDVFRDKPGSVMKFEGKAKSGRIGPRFSRLVTT